MATEAESPATTVPSAQIVGNAFVEQYYHILHHSPELVYKFYQDSSILSRQDPNGVISSVTTMQVSISVISFLFSYCVQCWKSMTFIFTIIIECEYS